MEVDITALGVIIFNCKNNKIFCKLKQRNFFFLLYPKTENIFIITTILNISIYLFIYLNNKRRRNKRSVNLDKQNLHS